MLAASVVATGAWAFYRFDAELRVENARAQLDKVKNELERRSNLKLELDVETLTGEGNEKFVRASVKIENMGKRSTTIHFSEASMRGGELIFDDDGNIFLGKTYTADYLSINDELAPWTPQGKEISSGEIDILEFLFVLENPGIYLFTFSAEGTPADKLEAVAAGIPASQENISWMTSTYFEVK